MPACQVLPDPPLLELLLEEEPGLPLPPLPQAASVAIKGKSRPLNM